MRRKLIALAVGFGLSILLGAWVGGTYLALIFWGVDAILLSTILAIVLRVLLPLIVGVVVGYLSREWGWLLAALVHVLRSVILFPLTPILVSLIDRVLAAMVGLEPGEWGLDMAGTLANLGLFTFLSALGGLIGEVLFVRRGGRQLTDKAKLRLEEEAEGDIAPGFFAWYFHPSPSALIKIPTFLLFAGLTFVVIAFDFRTFLTVAILGIFDTSFQAALYWFGLLLIPAPLAAFYEIWSPRHRISKSLRYGLTIFVVPAWIVAHFLLIALGSLLGGRS